MSRVRWMPILMLLVPQTSSAIQLRWSSGGSALAFTPATRCTVVVEADSTEGRLPGEWRLLWVADSCEVRPTPLEPSTTCAQEVAEVASLAEPATAADSSAHLLTAHFCSSGEIAATRARFVLDLPAGSAGKLKTVAIDPSDPDSSRVIESGEVTFNGGAVGEYPAVVLHASSVHQSLQLRVTAVGSGLGATNSLSIVAPDSSWSLPLTITARTDSAITAVASVAALLPACEVSVGAESGVASSATLPADEEPALLSPQSCHAEFFEELLLPPPPLHGYTIQPKDFAFARGFVDASSNRLALHLFYIRHSYYNIADDDNEKNIGHTWTTDFNSWHPNPTDTTALKVRLGKFDELHVWAPTIVQRGPTFWMFYTGVRNESGRRNQRIGVATSTDLNTWTPADTVVLSAPQIPWASKNPLAYGAQQLRDPFVMEDPVNPGQWLMYFVAVDSLGAPKMAVGAARSSDLLNWIAFAKPFSSTERPILTGATNVVESPHVFKRNGQWWLPYTVNNDSVYFETTASTDPADTVATHWTNPVWLRGVAEGQPSELQYWHASEYLKVAPAVEYLAAWNDNASSIDIKGVFAPANAAVDSFLLSCPQITGVADRNGSVSEVTMAISRLRWGASEVGLRLELPSRMPVRLAVYDIAGRRRSTLLDRELSGGVTEVTWDGRDEVGVRVASGMYFVRLTFARGARVSKIVMLR